MRRNAYTTHVPNKINYSESCFDLVGLLYPSRNEGYAQECVRKYN